jgi:hypothetical protein
VLSNSTGLRDGTPTRCARCGEPLRITEFGLQCWRSSDGEFYCNEFCADDADEAAFRSRSQSQK